jgi:SAM-dependent methyltransferase
MTSPDRYFATRYTEDVRRAPVWRHIVHYLARWIPPNADVLELGAGYCDFSNAVVARSRIAVDQDPTFAHYAAPGVRTIVGACDDLNAVDTASVDVVFASNLFEHLERPFLLKTLAEVRRVLRPTGRLVLVQPNFRLCPRQYFDDYTHVAVFTDRSLPDLLETAGFERRHVEGRFLPLTMKSRLSFGHRLVPLYLRLPWRPLAGQMLVIADRAA